MAGANDLSGADGRFAPAILEVAANRAVQAWALAIDGSDHALDEIATPGARRELLYAGDTSGSLRLVVRGPVVNRIRVAGLDANAQLAGSRTRKTSFTERWTLSLTDDARQPWRITAVSSPVGLA